MSAVVVSSEVFEGLMVVRDTGVLNMFDYHGVIGLARSLGYEETAVWMETHKKEYSEGIFMGFAISEGCGWSN